MKRRGPRTDPWGTPWSNSSHKLKFWLIFVLCIYYLNNWKGVWGCFYRNHTCEVLPLEVYGLLCRMLRTIPSNTAPEKPLLSKTFFIFQLMIIMLFFTWDSLHASLNSHYKAWSYKKKKHKKIKAYRLKHNRYLLISDLKPFRS